MLSNKSFFRGFAFTFTVMFILLQLQTAYSSKRLWEDMTENWEKMSNGTIIRIDDYCEATLHIHEQIQELFPDTETWTHIAFLVKNEDSLFRTKANNIIEEAMSTGCLSCSEEQLLESLVQALNEPEVINGDDVYLQCVKVLETLGEKESTLPALLTFAKQSFNPNVEFVGRDSEDIKFSMRYLSLYLFFKNLLESEQFNERQHVKLINYMFNRASHQALSTLELWAFETDISPSMVAPTAAAA